MAAQIYGFIFAMWILMLIGGGLMIYFVAPISFANDIDPIITSGTKVSLALLLIFIWVYTLTKIKNWIFSSQIKY
jgi:hypothetical protein